MNAAHQKQFQYKLGYDLMATDNVQMSQSDGVEVKWEEECF